MRHFLKSTIAALGLVIATAPVFAADYSVMAPAAPGGGWDQTARTIQSVFKMRKSPAMCR